MEVVKVYWGTVKLKQENNYFTSKMDLSGSR